MDFRKQVWDSVQYKRLHITAANKDTDIWLEDESGSLVQHEQGEMNTSLIGGIYYLHFGKMGRGHPGTKIELFTDHTIAE